MIENKILEAIKNTNFICFCGKEIIKKNPFIIKCNNCNLIIMGTGHNYVYINVYFDKINGAYGFSYDSNQVNIFDICVSQEEIISIIKIGDFAKIKEKYDKYSLFK